MKAIDIQGGLTADRLRAVLHYDPGSGALSWKRKSSANSRVKVGSSAGCWEPTGYLRVWIDGKRYVAHRLVWLYVTDEWPVAMIDHIDGDPTNNRWGNLRAATNSENKANGKTYRKRSGLPKGVKWNGDRYGAQIVHNYKHYHLGSFDSLDDASAAYASAAKRLHGEFARAA